VSLVGPRKLLLDARLRSGSRAIKHTFIFDLRAQTGTASWMCSRSARSAGQL
jgi:hypothetical protein